ncbi:Pheromone-regulated membrane protein 10 [Psilocybe cubensis]|uniref:Pheromone-regulated membrane protein 10 n=1 Tax=Psilocybe cubensis TaxID=181762 RepID=A0ACB8GHF8_PSICU|nr:Pheromone-regulated membrane protein 10 [Psilocybe cubensis]KAH9475044.1 Pheromone-regulated membrane protein 10 [Psilocybe cubensis]
MDQENRNERHGGLSRSSGRHGSKTPRKVQWPDAEEDSSTHALDEQGLDRERFQELTDALERHRDKGTPLKKVHYYSPQSTTSTSDTDNEAEVSSISPSESEPEIKGRRHYPNTPPNRFINYPPTPSEASPTHDVPGNIIDEDEDSGLPGTKDLRQFSMKQAEQVVKKHIGKRSRSHSLTGRRPTVEHQPHDIFEKDAERHPDDSSVHGKGILSTVLNLYQYPSSARSLFSSRSSLESDSGHSGSEVESSDLLPQDRKVYSRPKVKMPSMFGRTTRPSTARSGAGVFGPLIVSAGNLAGVAAPQASQLQPNVKRPGYKLSRYSLEPKYPNPPPMAKRRHSSGQSDVHRHPRSSLELHTTPPISPTESHPFYKGGHKMNLSNAFGGYVSSIRSGISGHSTPRTSTPYGSDTDMGSPRRKPHKRKKAEIFITRHIAHIIRREEFIMKLTRTMMMFGGPTHRLQSQIMSAARVLDVQLSFLYLPDIVLLSFDDSGTGTSHVRFIRQTSALDLGKLADAFSLYWKVIHDKLSVSDASSELDALMKKRPMYNWWQQVVIGGMCSASICTISFAGSFIDALASFPLGAILVVVQILGSRNTLYSYVFDSTKGFLVLSGALELMSRQIIPGSVRLLFAVVYALFLGFGFSIGAGLFELFTKHAVYGAEDFMCELTHDPSGPWYQRTPSKWWAFLTVPMFSFFLSLRNQAPYNRKEIILLVAIASAGWVTNYFTGRRYVGQGDIIAAVGAFAVGFIANAYARFFSGNAFVVMITGILFQLPSGLGSGGLLSYASEQAGGSANSYLSGFRTALKLVSVAIGLTIGLGLSLVLVHPIQSRKREAGIFSL